MYRLFFHTYKWLVCSLFLVLLCGFSTAFAANNYNFDAHVKDVTLYEATVGTTRSISANEFYGLNCDHVMEDEDSSIVHAEDLPLKNLVPNREYTCRIYIYYSPNGGQIQGISEDVTFTTKDFPDETIVEDVVLYVEPDVNRIHVEWELLHPNNIDGVAVTLSTKKYIFKENVPKDSENILVELFDEYDGSITFEDLHYNTDYYISLYPFYLEDDEKKILTSVTKMVNTADKIDDFFSIYRGNISLSRAEVHTDRPLAIFEDYGVTCHSSSHTVVSDMVHSQTVAVSPLRPNTRYSCRMYVYHERMSGTFGRSHEISFRTFGDAEDIAFLPLPPENLQLQRLENKIREERQIKVIWENKNAMDGFYVYRSKNGEPFERIAQTLDTMFLDSEGIDRDSMYCYFVTGLTSSYESLESEIVCDSFYQEDRTLKRPIIEFLDPVHEDIEIVENPFPDINIHTLAGQAAVELFLRGVVGGFPDGEFKGEKLVNRAQAAKILLLTKFGEVEHGERYNRFRDVVSGEWYENYVLEASMLEIINGYPDGTFKPDRTINTAEFLKMLIKTFQLEENLPYGYLDVPYGTWYAPYAGIAEKYKLFPFRTTHLLPDSEISRNDMVIAIYQYLKNRDQ